MATTFDPARIDADITLSGGNLTATHNNAMAASATVTNGGTTATYVVNDILTVSGGTFTTAAQFKVTAVSSGSVTAVTLQTAGTYSVTPANPAATTGGSGAGCTLTVTYTGRDAIAPGIGFHSTGRWSFRITLGTITAGHTQVGMCDSTTVTGLGNFLGSGNTTSFGIGTAGGVLINGSNRGNVGSYGASAVVDFAVDLTNALLWVRYNSGNWNNNAANSPGGAGGQSLSVMTTFNLSPAVDVYSLNDSAVLNTLPGLGIVGFPDWDAVIIANTREPPFTGIGVGVWI